MRNSVQTQYKRWGMFKLTFFFRLIEIKFPKIDATCKCVHSSVCTRNKCKLIGNIIHHQYIQLHYRFELFSNKINFSIWFVLLKFRFWSIGSNIGVSEISNKYFKMF